MANQQESLQQKKEYQDKVRAEFDKLSAQIDELDAKARQAEADAKLEYQNQIESLRAKQQAVQSMLEDLQAAGETAWIDIQVGLDKAYKDLHAAFNMALSRFQ